MQTRTLGSGDRTRTVSSLALGAMRFGTTTDEATSFAILDRYVEAGGTFIDTSNNYAFWVDGTQGGESERLLGRWLRTTGADGLTIATKVGGRPTSPTSTFGGVPLDGLSPANLREAAERSLEHLGRDRIDLYYAHIPDPAVPLADQVAGFAALVEAGLVDLLGVSNHWPWQVERARALASAAGLPGYDVLQYEHTYLRARTDVPTRFSPEGSIGMADGGVLSYLADQPELTMVAYSPLVNGAYTRADKPLPDGFDHPGTHERLARLAQVAEEAGRSANEVVLAQMSADPQVVPLVGASSVAQLDESLAGVALELDPDQLARLG